MTNQETQYQTRLVGNGLNESPASYDTLMTWCHNPHWTLKKLSQATGRKYDQIRQWAIKYHYATRKQAYLEHIHQELHDEILAIKKKQLESYLEQEDNDQEIITDDQYITRQIQQNIKKKINKDEVIDKDEATIYTTVKESYMKTKKDHAVTTQTVIKTTVEGTSFDNINTDELSPGARNLIESINRRRQEEKTNAK